MLFSRRVIDEWEVRANQYLAMASEQRQYCSEIRGGGKRWGQRGNGRGWHSGDGSRADRPSGGGGGLVEGEAEVPITRSRDGSIVAIAGLSV